jgi:uncharacterized protein YcbX
VRLVRVAQLFVYPVKSCRGVQLDAAAVEPWGFAGDRRWMFVDPDGVFVSQREESRLAVVVPTPTAAGLSISWEERTYDVSIPGLEAPRIAVQVWRSRLEARLAAEFPGGLRLVYMNDPTLRQVDLDYGMPEDRVSFADGYPVLLIGAASLEDLNGRLAVRLPMNRFRPNVVIEGSVPYAEDGWRRVRIGEVAFRVVKPCARCVVTTVDQATGTRGDERTEPLRTLATYRRSALGVLFGQNLVPDGTGTIRVGDEVEVLA